MRKYLIYFLLIYSFNVSSQCLNVALNKPATASSYYLNDTPSMAFNNNCSSDCWNSGGYSPAWLMVDLQGSYTINNINLIVAQLPNGTSSHQILTAPTLAGPWTLVETITGYTYQGQLIQRCYNTSPLLNVGAVKISTLSSNSWIAWEEIGVFTNSSSNASVSASGPLTFCQGGAVTLTANTGSSYLWSNGATTQSIIVTTSGTYSVTVGGSNISCINGNLPCTNCSSSSATTTVTVNPLPVVTANSTAAAVCAGASVTLTGGGASTYTWSGGVTNAVSFIPTATATYTVTGTNANGCINTATTTVTVNPLPVVTTTTTSSSICFGGNSTLTANGATTYAWMPGNLTGQSITVSPTATTTYTVTGTNANGCINTATTTVTVNPLPVVTTTTTAASICIGASTTITAIGATTYTWMPGNLTGATITVSPIVTTTYTVTGTNANGCINTATRIITVNPLPIVTATSTAAAVCTGASVMLTGGGATSYSWSGGVTNAVSFIPTATTTYTVTGTNANGCVNTATITVIVNPLPVVTTTTTTASICIGASTTITAIGATTYTWMPGNLTGATITVSPIATTTYTVTGTNANGCTNTATRIITVNPLPIVTATSTAAAVCTGSSVTLTGGGASTYTWDNNVMDAVSFVPTATTTYMVTGTDANGCVNTAMTTVTVNPLPVVTASSSSAAVCTGGSVTLTGGGASTYSWTNNVTNAVSFIPTATTTYTVTGTDANACVNTAMTTVTVNPLPIVTATSSAAAVCTGGSVTLTGGGAATYVWDNNVTDAISFIPTATTTYMVTATDANGCVNTATTTLTVNALPTVTANTSSASVCTGGSVTLTGGGAATYVWDNNVTDAISFVPIATTTYMVIGTDLNSCMNTAMITVTVNPLPVVTATSSAASVCTGGSVTLTGGGAATYVWDNNVIDAVSFVPTATTTYMVTGTDANGCVNTATTTVTLNGLLTVSLGPDIIQCGGTALLDAGNIGSVYLWNNASTTQTITVSTSGTYIVDVTDVNGCMGSDTAVVTINTAPSVTATASSVVVCVDDATVSLTGTPTGGVWSGPGVTGSSLSPTAAGVGLHAAIYSYSDANGCEGIASINVQVNACVGFVENTLGNCVSVYPNPALNEINIQSKFNSINSNYFIYDQFGRVVLNGKILNTVTRVDLEKLSSGLYIFTMDTTDNFIFKFVKE